jgi:hypothetical protein
MRHGTSLGIRRRKKLKHGEHTCHCHQHVACEVSEVVRADATTKAASGRGAGVTGSKKCPGSNLVGSGYVVGLCMIALPGGGGNNGVKNVGE